MPTIGNLLIATALTGGLAPVPPVSDTVVRSRLTLADPSIDDQDDMCVWVHPGDPASSTIIVADKYAEMVFVYDLAGNTLQAVPAAKPGNIDVRYGFPLNGKSVDIVAWNDRQNRRIVVYGVSASGRLTRLDDGSLSTRSNYGFCLHHDRASGAFHAFVTAKNGTVSQYRLSESGSGISGTEVRRWDLGSQVEACVADDEEGVLYLGEERVGIWKVGADASAPTTAVPVARVGDASGLTADVEGLALYYAPGGSGYLIASSQGSDRYCVYERRAPHAFVKSFRIVGVSGTDGLDVVSTALGPSFPFGILTVHNSTPSRKTVEVCAYEDLGLSIDTTYWDPRPFHATTAPAGPASASWSSIKSSFRR